MKSNIIAFFLSIGSIALAVIIVWFYNLSDRTPPEMRFVAMDLIYNSQTNEADLLNGVMAYDAVDGDITNRVVVEKTIFDEEQGTAVVYYAVSDLSGNVTKQSRVFPADLTDINGTDEEAFEQQEGMFPAGFATVSETGEVSEVEGVADGEAVGSNGQSESTDSGDGNTENSTTETTAENGR